MRVVRAVRGHRLRSIGLQGEVFEKANLTPLQTEGCFGRR